MYLYTKGDFMHHCTELAYVLMKIHCPLDAYILYGIGRGTKKTLNLRDSEGWAAWTELRWTFEASRRTPAASKWASCRVSEPFCGLQVLRRQPDHFEPCWNALGGFLLSAPPQDWFLRGEPAMDDLVDERLCNCPWRLYPCFIEHIVDKRCVISACGQ